MQLKKKRIDNLIGQRLLALHLVPVRVIGKLLRLNHQLTKEPQKKIIEFSFYSIF